MVGGKLWVNSYFEFEKSNRLSTSEVKWSGDMSVALFLGEKKRFICI